MSQDSNHSKSNQAKQVKCPQCGFLAFYSTQNPYRPFCSERCKLIDLGAWASENYRVPISLDDKQLLELADNEAFAEQASSTKESHLHLTEEE